jgi:hypothetical protein
MDCIASRATALVLAGSATLLVLTVISALARVGSPAGLPVVVMPRVEVVARPANQASSVAANPSPGCRRL